MKRRMAAAALLLFALLSPALRAQTPPQPTPTPDVVERIKDEGLNRSEVMKTLEFLTDVIGPRLTGSPGHLAAAQWAIDRFKEWGLTNPRLDSFPFGLDSPPTCPRARRATS